MISRTCVGTSVEMRCKDSEMPMEGTEKWRQVVFADVGRGR